MYILGIVTKTMTAGEVYYVRIAGVQNPRFQILTAADDGNQHFRIKTFDSNLNPSTMQDADLLHIIDEGMGGHINIDELSQIESFGAEAYNATNGVVTEYNINWFTSISTASGDVMNINFPAELTLEPTNGDGLVCSGLNGIGSVSCKRDSSNKQMMVIQMASVSQKTGLFKVRVNGIRNAPSLKPSSPFGQIYQATSDNKKTSEFKNKVTLTNLYAAAL